MTANDRSDSAPTLYRYRLTRNVWPQHDSFSGIGEGTCCFVMLNPSTADDIKDDPTIRRCIGYTRAFGCYSLEVVNLFAFRATNPDDLMDSYEAGIDIIGKENDWHIAEACNASRIIVCAWGNHGSYLGRDKEVLTLIRAQPTRANGEDGLKPMALKINKLSGQPAHPLYLPKNAQLIELIP